MRWACVIALIAAPVSAQEFFTLKGHGGPIKGIAVSSTGQVATASFDNSVGLWADGAPIWFEAHRAAVNTVTFAGDDRLVSAGDDNSVVLWADGTPRILGEHTAKVMGLAVSPDQTLVASASWDARVGLWPLDGSDPTFLEGHEKGVNAVAFTGDGQTLFSASVDGSIRIWDVATGKIKQQFINHGLGINVMALDEDAGWLAYGSLDGVTRLVDIETGDQIADFTLDRRPILSMAYDPDQGLLAVGDGEGYIMVIDTVAQKIARDFRATQKGPIWALAFSANGQNLHAGGLEDTMYSWPVAAMDDITQMDGNRSFLEDPATLPNGERQFKRKCSICHTVTPGSARKAGPTLYALFGRPAGAVKDYSYSDTLQGSDITWDEESIDALFDLGPDHYIPGTKMPMQRIVKPEDRDDLVSYLRDATAPKEN